MTGRRVTADSIKVGAPVPLDIVDENDRLLLSAGHIIDSQRIIDSLLARALFFREPVAAPRPRSTGSSFSQPLTPAKETNPFQLIDDAEPLLDKVLHKADKEPEFERKIGVIVEKIQQAVQLDADATMATVLLDTKDTYSIKHPINVSVMAEILLKADGVSDDVRKSVLSAALTMNLGMLDLQDVLHYQSTPLTQSQRASIREHPSISARALMNCGVQDEEWLATVRQHHEMIDGSGYPHGLKGDKITMGAKILAILDVFCAKLCPRAYRPGILPNIAMREIFLARGRTLDLDLSGKLVKQLGIYIPGTVVTLANGETAIVTRRGQSAGTPVATTILTPKGDVAAFLQRDTRKDVYQIKGVSTMEKLGVPVDRNAVWGY